MPSRATAGLSGRHAHRPAAGTKPSGYDARLLFPVLFLVGIGIVMVYSASSALALKQYGSDYYFLKRQATFALAGIVVLVAFRHFPYRFLKLLAYPLLAAALGALAAIQLTDLGYTPGPVDGKWGKKTEAALKQFQQAQGLSVTGTVDEATAQKLGL